MSARLSGFRRPVVDHFEPDSGDDPHAQRRLRGHLELVDYTAYAANREIIGPIIGPVDSRRFQKLAVACAQARGRWVAEALAMAEATQPVTPDRIEQLAQLRQAFEELAEAYEALRRMVERSYLPGPATDA